MQYYKNHNIKKILSDSESVKAFKEKEVFRCANAFSLIAFIFLIIFGIKTFLANLTSYSIILFLFASMLGASYLTFGRKRNPSIHVFLIVFMMGVLCLFLLYTGGEAGSGLLWYFVFPSLALFLLGINSGLLAIFLLFLSSSLLLLFIGTGFDTFLYSPQMIERAIAVFVAITIMACFYEYSRNQYSGEVLNLYQQKEAAARTDYLTNLPNRRYMQECLEYEMHRSRRSKKPFSLLLCDIDDFKNINDQFGHHYGDHVLCEFSNLLGSSLRTQDKVGRWGGEEFLVLLPETARDGAINIAEQLRQKVEQLKINFEQESIQITTSIGVVEAHDLFDINFLLQKVDENLYLAKSRGKNKVVSDIHNLTDSLSLKA